MFPAATYTDRRSALVDQLGGGLVLLLGNSESPMSFADNCHPFRQDSTFLYYCGLDQPDLAAVIDVDAGTTTIFGDELTMDHIVWMGDLPTLAARAGSVGVPTTLPAADLPTVLSAAADRPIHYLPPYRAANVLKLRDLLGHGDRPSLELIQAVIAQRSIKSAEEIEQIEQAVDISVEMHVAAMAMARPGMRESEICAEVERIARANGDGPSFQVIATVRGEVLHNHDHSGVLQAGDLFLLDAGAQSSLHYAGDLSSTFPVDARFTERQKTIYELCLSAHRAATELLAPGTPNRDVHFAAARVIFDGMKDLGLARGDTEEALVAGAHALWFPCGVGHMLGLDVHDMEDLGEVYVGYGGQPKSTQFGLKSLRLARALEPGFTITVEPGIYFIPQLIDMWRGQKRFAEFIDYEAVDRWRDFGGLRNEENWLITDEGAYRLGRKVKPMSVAEVEAIRGG